MREALVERYTRIKARLRLEASYLREDAAKVARSASSVSTPQRRSRVALLVGVGAITYGVAQWSAPLAFVLLGISALVYGAIIVDLDEDARVPRRRRPAA